MTESTTSPSLDIQIESLLSRDQESSIVDTLFKMPDEHELATEDDMFGRAVHDRLQARLAQKMRSMIDSEKAADKAA